MAAIVDLQDLQLPIGVFHAEQYLSRLLSLGDRSRPVVVFGDQGVEFRLRGGADHLGVPAVIVRSVHALEDLRDRWILIRLESCEVEEILGRSNARSFLTALRGVFRFARRAGNHEPTGQDCDD